MTLPRSLPAGTVTLLFTDIEGSTRMLREIGDRYASALADHHRILRSLVRECGGEEVDSQGEGMFFVFARAKDAVRAAVACQRALASHSWPEGRSVRVRMGLHTGEPERSATGYVGIDVHRAARIAASSHGQQIVLSQATRELLGPDLPEGVSLRDLGTHALRDLAHREHLSQVVAAGLPADFPALRSLDAHPHNLPRQLTSFIGRERELAEVEKLLGESPLLTLTGVGGCGKTRLAFEAAAALLDRFRDGVWAVELAPLADPSLVTRAVAAALGVREVAGRPLLTTLGDHLATKELLLCLDNCEHLLDACANAVDSLLRACPGLRVLATSRERLGVGGERIYPVPSLLGSEAVRLFVERARFHRPDFAVTPENAAAVTQICERLDGIPLALELAAARVRALSVSELAERLSDRFRLLTGGSRTALPRHQTLLAAIDWSYGLLSEPERAVLRSASVFAGGFSLESAEAVCAQEGVASDEILALLTRLVEKSLVNAAESNGETRYSLLETVRQFAREKLLDSGSETAARSSHLDWCLALAEAAAAKLETKDQLVWLARLDRENDNLRAALDWSIDREPAEPALRLTTALEVFWYMRGHWLEGKERFEAALTRAGPFELQEAKLKNGIALLAANLGLDLERCGRLVAEALEIYERLGHKAGAAKSLMYLGILQQLSPVAIGDRGRAHFEASLALAREIGDQAHESRCLMRLAFGAGDQGEGARALRLLHEGLSTARASGDRWALVLALESNSVGARLSGDFDRAQSFAEEGLTVAMELGHRIFIANTLLRIAEIAAALGKSERAARILGASERLIDLLGGPGSGRDPTAVLSSTRAALGEAAFESEFAAGRALTLDEAVAYALDRER